VIVPSGGGGSSWALRVKLLAVDGCPGLEGDVRWAGPPEMRPELWYAADGSTFHAAQLQNTPYFTDWVSWGLVQLFGQEVLPNSLYEVRVVDGSCVATPELPSCHSAPLLVATAKWGDIKIPFFPATGALQPDFKDISSQVDSFLAKPTAPNKSRAMLQPEVPDYMLDVSFKDISDCVDAFIGASYAYAIPTSTWYLDDDGDTYGDPAVTVETCDPPPGFVHNDDDCDDLAAAVNPGAVEVCNGIDDNCVDGVDEPGAVGCSVYYMDADADDYGVTADSQCLCAPTGSYTATQGGDCNDANLNVYPGATEVCNGIDDNCVDGVDEEGAGGCVTYYMDFDADGYGVTGDSRCLCNPSGLYRAPLGGDCDDDNDTINPGEPEFCNGIDDNCVDGVDEPGAADCTNYYVDNDGDTWGDNDLVQCLCAPSAPYLVSRGGDCNDSHSGIHPGVYDLPDDAFVDTNCDGIDGDRNGSLFVHPNGDDGNPGTIDAPLQHFWFAMLQQQYEPMPLRPLLAAGGVYSEPFVVVMARGARIYGGYDPADWGIRDDSYLPVLEVQGPEAARLEISYGIDAVHLNRLHIRGITPGESSSSTYGIRLYTSELFLEHCVIEVAKAGDGADGTDGFNGGAGASGGNGGRGCENASWPCSSCSRPAGGSPGSGCGPYRGGWGSSPGLGGGSGYRGEDGGNAGSGYGYGGYGGSSGNSGGDGYAGRPGASGTNGPAAPLPTFDLMYGTSVGGDGADGEYGSGGGGGGGGGGGTNLCDSYGGGGGGGGGGGCRGTRGTAGASAGGAFAVYAWGSILSFKDCTFITPDGAAGGDGGTGGAGGAGGNGGFGGGREDDSGYGGTGGNGGAGGSGGHGGGGVGGPTIGIFLGNGSILGQNIAPTFVIGAVGPGGASAGNPGADGIRAEVYP